MLFGFGDYSQPSEIIEDFAISDALMTQTHDSLFDTSKLSGNVPLEKKDCQL